MDENDGMGRRIGNEGIGKMYRSGFGRIIFCENL
jgi:hypothetical protein